MKDAWEVLEEAKTVCETTDNLISYMEEANEHYGMDDYWEVMDYLTELL